MIATKESAVVIDVTELVQSGARVFLLRAENETGSEADVEFVRDGANASFIRIVTPGIPPVVYPPKGCADRYETVSW